MQIKNSFKKLFRSRSSSLTSTEYTLSSNPSINYLYIGINVNRYKDCFDEFFCIIHINGVARQWTTSKTKLYQPKTFTRSLYYFKVNSMCSISIEYHLNGQVIEQSTFDIIKDAIIEKKLYVFDKVLNSVGSLTISLYYDSEEILTSETYVPLFPSLPYLNIIEASNLPEFLEISMKIVEEQGIEVEGIYRMNCSQNDLLLLSDEIKTTPNCDIKSILNNAEIFTICSMIKMFFRKLEPPLISKECCELMKITKTEDNIPEVLKSLTGPNRNTFIALVKHLKKIDSKSSINKMTLTNLAVVFAPNLFENVSNKFSVASIDINACFQTNQIDIFENFLKKFQTKHELQKF